MKKAILLSHLMVLYCITNAQQLKLAIVATQTNTTYEFSGDGDLTIDADHKVTGRIFWSVVKVDKAGEAYYKDKMKAKATEFVQGNYVPETRKLLISGYQKNDPFSIIGLDVYEISLADPLKLLGISKASGKWDGIINGSYSITVASAGNRSTTGADNKYIDLIKPRVASIANKLNYVSFSKDKVKEAGNYQVIEKYTDGSPKVIRFDIECGIIISNEWKNTMKGSVDVIFNGGIPYLIRPSGYDSPAFTMSFPVSHIDVYDKSTEFSKDTINRIFNLYNSYKTDVLKNDLSYQAVIKQQNSYPKEYDIKNCLAVIYEVKPMGWLRPKAHQNGVAENVQDQTLEAYVTGYQYQPTAYKNISNHAIVVKGIYKSPGHPKGNYQDESKILQPGETMDYCKIGEKFDDDSEYNVQFYGNPGVMKKIKIIPDK